MDETPHVLHKKYQNRIPDVSIFSNPPNHTPPPPTHTHVISSLLMMKHMYSRVINAHCRRMRKLEEFATIIEKYPSEVSE